MADIKENDGQQNPSENYYYNNDAAQARKSLLSPHRTGSTSDLGISKNASGEQRFHPYRGCILWTFGIWLTIITGSVFYAGIAVQRPLAGVLFLCALLPSFLILYVAYRRDIAQWTDEEKTPVEILVIAMVLGILSTFVVIVLSGYLHNFLKTYIESHMTFIELFLFIMFDAFLLTAGMEEGMKYLFGRSAVYDTWLHVNPYIVHPYGVVLFCLATALGFAGLENSAYIMGQKSEAAAWGLVIARGVMAVPLHGATGALIGVGFARRTFFNDETRTFWRVMAMPVFIHGLYDFIWMVNFRNGEFNPAHKSHRLHKEDNTIDVGDALGIMYFCNILFVVWAGWYVVSQVNKLCTEYDERMLRKSKQQV
jgi:protease PrsW